MLETKIRSVFETKKASLFLSGWAFFCQVSVSNEVFVKTPSLLSKDDVKKNCRFNNKLLTKISNNKIDKNTKQKPLETKT